MFVDDAQLAGLSQPEVLAERTKLTRRLADHSKLLLI